MSKRLRKTRRDSGVQQYIFFGDESTQFRRVRGEEKIVHIHIDNSHEKVQKIQTQNQAFKKGVQPSETSEQKTPVLLSFTRRY